MPSYGARFYHAFIYKLKSHALKKRLIFRLCCVRVDLCCVPCHLDTRCACIEPYPHTLSLSLSLILTLAEKQHGEISLLSCHIQSPNHLPSFRSMFPYNNLHILLKCTAGTKRDREGENRIFCGECNLPISVCGDIRWYSANTAEYPCWLDYFSNWHVISSLFL